MSKAHDLWLIGELKSQLFGIDCGDVIEMLAVPAVTKVPQMPESLRGVINLRGRVLPLIDLRKRLNMPSMAQEAETLCQLMDQRAQDHTNWLKELSDSVAQHRKFTLTTDPHKCAFGKWYDSYKSNNLLVSNFLLKFDAPHKQVHALAAQVSQLAQNGKESDALEFIQEAKDGVLTRMLRLFEQFRELIRDTHREIAIVLRIGGQDLAASMDAIQAVESLKPDDLVDLKSLGAFTATNLVKHAGRRNKTGELVLLLNSAEIVRTPSGLTAAAHLSAA